MFYFVQKRKKGTNAWETISTYDTKSKAITDCRWNAFHNVDSEEYKKLKLEWEYRVVNDAAVVLLLYIIIGNKRVKASINH